MQTIPTHHGPNHGHPLAQATQTIPNQGPLPTQVMQTIPTHSGQSYGPAPAQVIQTHH